MLERLNSLWIGNRFGYIELLTLVSALSTGHQFTVYSYTPDILSGVPKGVEIRDASEILPADQFRRGGGGGDALGSDFFRYLLLRKNVGYWVDMDVNFLKPLDFKQQYVFGWERADSINNAILRIPAQSDMARDLCLLPKTNWKPPFFGPKRSLLYYWARLTKGDVHVEDLPWGTLGPGLVTYLAKKYGVASQAQQTAVFYPIDYFAAHSLLEDGHSVDERIMPETRAVHLWHSRIAARVGKSPPPGSYLERACQKHGI